MQFFKFKKWGLGLWRAQQDNATNSTLQKLVGDLKNICGTKWPVAPRDLHESAIQFNLCDY